MPDPTQSAHDKQLDKIADELLATWAAKHVCLMETRGELAWARAPGYDPIVTSVKQERVLKQKWFCARCGKAEWRDIPEIELKQEQTFPELVAYETLAMPLDTAKAIGIVKEK